MVYKKIFLFVFIFYLLPGCNNDEPDPVDLQLLQVFMGPTTINLSGPVTTDIPVDRSITLNFSAPVDRATALAAISLSSGVVAVEVDISFTAGDKSLIVFPASTLKGNSTYTVIINDQLKGTNGQTFAETQFSFKTVASALTVQSLLIGNTEALSVTSPIQNASVSSSFLIEFSAQFDFTLVTNSTITLKDATGNSVPLDFIIIPEEATSLTVNPTTKMKSLTRYQLTLTTGIKGLGGEPFSQVAVTFYTGINADPVLPLIRHDEDNDADNTNDLLSVVQQRTFKYFWDFGHPASGMARERNTSGDIVTSGGTGFGIMALVVGMERNFISRAQGLERMTKIVGFLENADRFHGAWSHWINGSTGEVVPFSSKDDGGDLVETSFLVQGLITFRQYLKPAVPEEAALINRITTLWQEVEWDWYRKNNENVLYWHWSPNFNWDMNFALSGYFEEQITYFLAASSPTHGIPKLVYTNGYGKDGDIVKNNTYYTYTLPLESPAPLFWVHYSYLGLDPHFSDEYANYWTQNVNATLINQAYCIANPKKYVGYSERCWGLTSSDNQSGYDAHSPVNDKGVITPTAALSSFPYTPEASMNALKFFYYTLGDRLWGEYGFYDAFNLTDGWTANSYLAIDQGPIIVMIENYRTGLLWDLFMSAPEVQNGKTTLGFTN